MTKFKKYGISALIVIGALLVNFLISILLHGWLLCVTDDPFDLNKLVALFPDCEGAQILDTYQQEDAALTLLEKPDGSVFLLVFQKNLLLNKYQMLGAAEAPEGFQNAVQTVLLRCPLQVAGQRLVIDQEDVSRSVQPGSFTTSYGLNTLLLLGLEYLIYYTSFRKKKQKSKA